MSTKKGNPNRNKEQHPYVDITLTAEELKRLHGEPCELLKFYLIINQRRDFDTSIAGLKTRISDRTFKEGMEISGKQGRKIWKPTTTHIQRWLSQLVNLGLIEDRGNYVFYCPLAFMRKSEKIISHQNWYQSVTGSVTKKEEHKILVNKGLKQDLGSEVSLEVSPEVSPDLDTPPIIPGKDTYIPRDAGIFQQYLNLLSDEGFNFVQMKAVSTTLMMKEWVDAQVTVEQAKIGIEAANAKAGGKPNGPTYYKNFVLQAKREFDKPREVVNATYRTSRPVSNTESFFTEGVAALTAHRERKN